MIVVALLVACTSGETDTGPRIAEPDYACPGGDGCANNDGVFRAGAAIRSIVPTCFESWTDVDGDFEYTASTDAFLDCGCDRLCPTDAGYPGPDEAEANGTFEAAWMAGFGNGRAAIGVRGADQGLTGEGDGLWARVIVLKQGETSLAIASLDLVGWFHDDVPRQRSVRLHPPAV